jgi:SAM-dependent methyltransferase
MSLLVGLIILFFALMFLMYLPGKMLGPLVSSSKTMRERLFKLAAFTKGETFFDLGCGNGSIVLEAAKRYEVTAIGVEIAPFQFLWAQLNAMWHGHPRGAHFVKQDVMKVDLHDADVVYLYLLPHGLEKLKPKLERELTPGTRVLSSSFEIPGWEAVTVDWPNPKVSALYLYIV